MTIINKTTKSVESQPWRKENWMGDDWVEVPLHLEQAAFENAGYCELVFDDNGALVDIIPTERPPEPEPMPDLQADMAELLIDLTYRVTLLELGVSI